MAFSRRDFLRTSAVASSLVATGHWNRFASAVPPVSASATSLSPFLQGNFAPVRDEVTIDRLEVQGELPAELNGMFVRNGPNPQFTPRGNYHWFDGDGMLHGVRIADGRASYRNRYIRTAGWTEERGAGKALYHGLADPIDFEQVLQGKGPFKNVANTALAYHDRRLLALWEGGEPYQVDVPELATIGPYKFDGKLRHPFTAHPKIDPQTGEMLFFGYSPLNPQVHYSRVDSGGELVQTETIQLRRPVMMHDFAVTAKHAIFLDLPVVFGAMPKSAHESAPTIAMRFDRELGSRFGILPRRARGDEIRWFESSACFVFHTLGAYEEGQEVVLIACRMEDYPHALQFGSSSPDGVGNPLLKGPQGRLHRWRFNLTTGKTSEESLDDVPCDFPRFNDRLMGQPMRYGYCMLLSMQGFIKHDLKLGISQRHEFKPGRFGGEGVFIPRSGGVEEDDGWLATFLYDESTKSSELILIDCRAFSAPPVARIKIPARIPFGFHGIWLDGEAWDMA